MQTVGFILRGDCKILLSFIKGDVNLNVNYHWNLCRVCKLGRASSEISSWGLCKTPVVPSGWSSWCVNLINAAWYYASSSSVYDLPFYRRLQRPVKNTLSYQHYNLNSPFILITIIKVKSSKCWKFINEIIIYTFSHRSHICLPYMPRQFQIKFV